MLDAVLLIRNDLFQGCGSESAFIFSPGFGSAFRIQEGKCSNEAEKMQENCY